MKITVQDVINNNNTIRGKMAFLSKIDPDDIMAKVVIINIGELERIRNDLESSLEK